MTTERTQERGMSELELETKFLRQAAICNLQNENLVMNGDEQRARYWEGRSDAFQDAVAFVRAALAAAKSEQEQPK